jgi:hypothetical protein
MLLSNKAIASLLIACSLTTSIHTISPEKDKREMQSEFAKNIKNTPTEHI